MQLNGIEGQLGFWESQKRGTFLLPFIQFYCDLEIKLKNLNRWNCVIVHISFNGIEIEPFLSPVAEVPPPFPYNGTWRIDIVRLMIISTMVQ